MAPNKTKPNAFYFFMQERRPMLERQLHRKITMAETPELLYSEWKDMSATAKEKYVRMCDSTKSSMEKLDSRGIPLSLIEAEIKRAEKDEETMKKNIRFLIASNNDGKGHGIANLNIYIVSLQIYTKLADESFLPAEIGVVKFNFKKGLISEFHKIIKAEIPSGYQYQVALASENSHNLFENKNHAALQRIAIDRKNIITELENYLQQDNYSELNAEYVLYTPKSNFEVAKNILACDGIKIYSLDFLYMQMYNFSTEIDEIPFSIAEDALNASLYDYNPNPACFFHRRYIEDNVKYCALSEVKRLCYNMCLHIDIKKRFNIEPITGRHLPENSKNVAGVSFVMPPQPPQRTDDSISENMDNLSLISDVTASTTSAALPHFRNDNDILPAGINFLRGAWAAPSTVGSINTEDDDEFPTLGASSYRAETESKNVDALLTKPKGVLMQSSAISNVGLQGFGRGKSFSRKSNKNSDVTNS